MNSEQEVSDIINEAVFTLPTAEDIAREVEESEKIRNRLQGKLQPVREQPGLLVSLGLLSIVLMKDSSHDGEWCLETEEVHLLYLFGPEDKTEHFV